MDIRPSREDRDVTFKMNIVQIRNIYETAHEDCEKFAGAEFDDALALVRQDAALSAQMRALDSLSRIESSGLRDVLLKFEIWRNHHEESEHGTLSPQSDALIRSIHQDLMRIAGQ